MSWQTLDDSRSGSDSHGRHRTPAYDMLPCTLHAQLDASVWLTGSAACHSQSGTSSRSITPSALDAAGRPALAQDIIGNHAMPCTTPPRVRTPRMSIKAEVPSQRVFWKDCLPSQAAHSRPLLRYDASAALSSGTVVSTPSMKQEATTGWRKDDQSAMEIDLSETVPIKLPLRPSGDDETPTISELVHGLRAERHSQQRHTAARQKLLNASYMLAMSCRMLCRFYDSRDALADCLLDRSNDRFVNIMTSNYDINDTYHDLKDFQRKPYSQAENTHHDSLDQMRNSPSFMATLSSAARRDVLDMLLTVRHDPQYVADRVCRLPQNELLQLVGANSTSSLNASLSNATTLQREQSSPRSATQANSQEDPSRQRTLLSQTNPFSALIFMPFGAPLASNNAEESKRTRLASLICKQLLLHSRPGADQFILKVLDTWIAMREWLGKKTFELFLLEAIERGDRYVRRPSHQYSNSSTSSIRPTEVQKHILSSLDSFYSLFTTCSVSTILPAGFTEMARALCSSLEDAPQQKSSLKGIIICKWLFAKFFNEAIRFPEKYGLLLDRYISTETRTHFLVPLSNAIQDCAFRTFYHWPSDELKSQIARSVLNDISTEIDNSSKATHGFASNPSPDDAPTILLVNPSETVLLAELLYSHSTTADPMYNHPENASTSTSLASLSYQSFSAASTAPSTSFILSQSVSSATSISSQMIDDDVSQVWRPEPSSTNLHTTISAADLGSRLIALCSDLRDRHKLEMADTQFNSRNFDVLLLGEGATGTSSLILGHGFDPVELVGLQSELQVYPSGEDDERKDGKDLHSFIGSIISDIDASLLFDDRWKAHCPVNVASFQDLLQHAATVAKDSSDIRNHHKLICACHALSNYDTGQEMTRMMLSRIKTNIKDADNIASTYEDYIFNISLKQQIVDATAQRLLSDIQQLRDKMWYTTDVRNSGPYEDARTIALALTMVNDQTEKRKESVFSKFRATARPWISSNSSILRTEIQVMDLITAPQVQGGYGKLADEQVEMLRTWIRQKNIDTSLCKGEERLFRLFIEIRRCIAQLAGFSLMETPVLWTSDLFRRERATFDVSITHSTTGSPQVRSQLNYAQKSQTRTSAIHNNSRPGRVNIKNDDLWHPATEQPQPQAGLRSNSEGWESKRTLTTHDFIFDMRKSLSGFLFCDLVKFVFPEGSETDRWMGSELIAKSLAHSPSASLGMRMPAPSVESFGGFSYQAAMHHYLRLFSVQANPYAQLESLVNLHEMVIASLTNNSELSTHPSPVDMDQEQTRAVVHTIRDLLNDSNPLPKSLFCNLQYMSIFISSRYLDQKYQNRSRLAFHHFSLAALMLKQAVCESLVIAADDIVAFHTQRRGHQDVPKTVNAGVSTAADDAKPSSLPLALPTVQGPPEPHRTMAAAAQLWLITAKEGLPLAQRELATFYLTHPDLLPRATLPMVPPRAVFRPERLATQTDLDPAARTDPYTMCVAVHWMEESARGGDPLAMGFLQNREELGAIG